MEYVVKTRSKRTRHFIEHIMPSMIKQLGLTNSRKVVLIEVTKKFTGEGNEGSTMPLPGLDCYIVTIKPGRWQDMGVTLAHEMVHVRQLAKGILRAEGGVKFWKGKRYSKRTKYLNMPWELDALSKQDIIFRRAID